MLLILIKDQHGHRIVAIAHIIRAELLHALRDILAVHERPFIDLIVEAFMQESFPGMYPEILDLLIPFPMPVFHGFHAVFLGLADKPGYPAILQIHMIEHIKGSRRGKRCIVQDRDGPHVLISQFHPLPAKHI